MYIITVKSNKDDYWRSLGIDCEIGASLIEYKKCSQRSDLKVFESLEEAKLYRDEDFFEMLKEYEEIESCKLSSSIEYVSKSELREIYNER